MKPTKVAKNEKKIEFKIVEIKKIRYFETNPGEYDLAPENIHMADVNLGVKFTINEQEETLLFHITAMFLHSKEDEKYELFGIETLHVYKIKSFLKHFIAIEWM